MHSYQLGEQVYWWKRYSRQGECPYRAEVVAVGAKRITIAITDLEDRSDRIIRHVAATTLQPIAAYYEKAAILIPRVIDPAASWGRFTQYLAIAEDLRSERQIQVYENGNMLSYDRTHWIDDFGTLGDAQINRNRKHGIWGHSEEIDADEFERVWATAQSSPIREQQIDTVQMERWGTAPVWFTIRA